MPNKRCMYEGCDAPEHRKSGYCIRHTESGPRSILINTSKFVNEKPSDEVKVEFVKEEEIENEEEALPEIEEKAQEEDIKVEKKRKGKKKTKRQNQIILPVKPNAGNTTLAMLFICMVSFMFIVSGDEDIICSTCCISGILLFILSTGYTSKQLDYQNSCIDKIERYFDNENIDDEIPKEPSTIARILSFAFGFLAIVCLFDDHTAGWSFILAPVWFLCYQSFNSDMKNRNDFIEAYRKNF
ncbi:MAG: hypothetical protein VYC12_01280 [Candidatus Thermoplasmatota archaeon]|nr:hypothetical protein [Candidatus Thermoplasmatota archaeon]